MAASPLVLRLADEACTQPALVGEKAASLARLVQAGFAVPDGVVITTAVYSAHAAGLEAEAEVAVTEAYAALSAGAEGTEPPFVAVRSSGTAEDLAGASFAGMHDTFLDVRGNAAVLAAVRRCWASLWNERADAYRQARSAAGAPAEGEPLLAVVLQRMVDTDVSGVLFTANPLTGSRDELVLNAAWGLGEGVVSGIVTPDEFVVDRATLTCTRRTLGAKEVTVVRSPTGAGTVEVDTPRERATAYSLDDGQLAQLAALGRDLVAHASGIPQDVEWAIEGGRIHVLQSRPITGPGFDGA